MDHWIMDGIMGSSHPGRPPSIQQPRPGRLSLRGDRRGKWRHLLRLPSPSLRCASSSVSLADAVPPRGRLVELQQQGQLLGCHCSSTTSAPVLPPSLPRRAFTRAHLPPMPAVPGHQRPAYLRRPTVRAPPSPCTLPTPCAPIRLLSIVGALQCMLRSVISVHH